MNSIKKQNNLNYIVAIGASAGGLNAIKSFFDNIPSNTNNSYVVLQHLSPDFESLMSELLINHTDMDIIKLTHNTQIRPNTIYLNQPSFETTIKDETLVVTPSDNNHLKMPIDLFLTSLANQKNYNFIAIILSGTGSDGSKGILEVAKNNGRVFVQSPEEAEFDSMPINAINTKKVNYILEIPKLANAIINYTLGQDTALLDSFDDEAMTEYYREIYNLLYPISKNNYRNYKSSTINRRITRRMQFLKVLKVDEYIGILKKDPQELALLEKDLLIGVTEFMRDAEAFETIRTKIIPKIVTKHIKDNSSIRVWVSACSTGEEAYSIAILFLEYFEQHKLNIPIKIFATDVNKSSITTASNGIYESKSLKNLNSYLINKYFKNFSKNNYKVIQKLRDNIIFAQHNLISDIPFNQMDLVTCRNFLIYIKSLMQANIVQKLIFATNVNGFLFLGSSESMTKNQQIKAFDNKWKIYSKIDFDSDQSKDKELDFDSELSDPLPENTHNLSSVKRDENTALLDKKDTNNLKTSFSDNDKELRYTNEELQSTNEELQSTNEELHSVNEELYTVNAEYQEKIIELNRAKTDIDNILKTSQIGTLIIDCDLNIRLITSAINQVINIFDHDIGRNISDFSHSLKINNLIEMLKHTIKDGKEISIEAEDKYNNWYILRIFQYKNKDGKIEGAVLTITNITSYKRLNSRFYNAIESLIVGVIIVNEKGRISFYNNFLANLIGYDKNELLNQKIEVLIEKNIRLNHKNLQNNYLKDPKAIDMSRNAEINILAKDGSTIPVSISLIPYIESNNKQSIICNILDMTKIRKAEKILSKNQEELECEITLRSAQLLESEKKVSLLYHNSPDMHASVDPETAIIQQCNNTLIETLGYKSTDEIIGKSIFELYHYTSLDEVKEAFRHFQKTGFVENLELNLKTTKGIAFPVILKVNSIKDADGKIISSVSSWRDISELKSLRQNQANFNQDKKLYEKNEQLYNTVLNSVSDGWWDWHLKTDNIYISPSFKTLLGYDDDDLLNHLSTWEKLSFDEDFTKFKQEIDNCLADEKQQSFSIELRFRHKNNSTIWILCRGVALKENGQNYRIIGTNIDISNSKELESNLQEAKNFAELTLNASEDKIFIKDKDYKIIQANTAFLNLYPKDVRDSVIGSTTVEKYNKEEAKLFLANDKSAFDNGISKVIETVRMPNGKKVTFNTTKIRFYGKYNTPFILGISRDVTERESLFEKVEESKVELEHTNQKLVSLNEDNEIQIKKLTEINSDIRQLLDSSDDTVIFLDKDFSIKRFSSKAKKLFKLNSSSITKSFFSLEGNLDLSKYKNFIKTSVLKKNTPLKEIFTNDGRVYLLRVTPYLDIQKNLQGCILNFIEITELRKSEQMIRDNQDLLQLAAKNAGIGIWNWFCDSDKLEWNDGMFSLMPISKKDFKKNYDSFIGCIAFDDRQMFNSALDNSIATKKPFSIECRINTDSNDIQYTRIIGEFYAGNEYHPNRLTGICIDITPIKQAEIKLDRMAKFDSITGVSNREYFLSQLQGLISRAKRYKTPLALFFLDLDGFKQVNDTFGHAFGDILLEKVVFRLKRILREEDMIGRIGGDEFAIAISQANSIEEVRQIANRCIELVNNPFRIKNHEIYQSFSLGISIYPDTANTIDNLLQYADTAMYRAKEKGKNNFVFFQDDLDKKMQRQNSIEYALRKSVSENNFKLVYQPQYNQDQQITGLEALLRWDCPELNNPRPDEFIPIAEKTRRIVDIGNWVLEKSIQDFLTLPEKIQKSITLSINFSGVQLADKNIIFTTTQILNRYAIDSKKLVFEITETHLMNNIKQALSNMDKLHKLGVCFSLDDFGTGYSSLNYLAKLPISYLKIDKAFIDKISDSANKTIVKSMITLAKSLNMDCVAEGVEKKTQFDYLNSMNCDKYQGYYFSRPVDLEQLKKVIS